MLAYEAITETSNRHRGAQYSQLDFAANPPSVTFEGIDKTYHAQFLGSFSGIDNTWMWGWNNINDYPETAIMVANNVRHFGELANVSEFTTPVLPIKGEADIHRLMFAVGRLTGRPAFHRARTEHGHVYFSLHDYEMLPPGVVAAQRAIMTSIEHGWIVNHRVALDAYAEMRPVQMTDTEDGGKLLRCADGVLELGFDEHHRIAKARFEVNDQTVHGLQGE